MKKTRDYRPTNDDFRPTQTQQLSCRDAGKFDYERAKGLIKKAAQDAAAKQTPKEAQ